MTLPATRTVHPDHPRPAVVVRALLRLRHTLHLEILPAAVALHGLVLLARPIPAHPLRDVGDVAPVSHDLLGHDEMIELDARQLERIKRLLCLGALRQIAHSADGRVGDRVRQLALFD